MLLLQNMILCASFLNIIHNQRLFYIISEPKACGRPEQPPNSTMVAPKGFEVDATIEYGCDDGHLLVGPSKRLCMDTGFYNEFPPVCKCKLKELHNHEERKNI